MIGHVVRRATIADADDLFKLVEEYYEVVSVVQRDSRERVTHYLDRDDCGAWLAVDGAAAVGCVLYHPLPSLEAAGEMKRLYVRPAWRRRGLAKRLVDEAERFARHRRDAWLYLDTKDDLADAVAFYERNGYRRCPRYNDNPQATIFMRKNLRL